jgi:hypothetical protein
MGCYMGLAWPGRLIGPGRHPWLNRGKQMPANQVSNRLLNFWLRTSKAHVTYQRTAHGASFYPLLMET